MKSELNYKSRLLTHVYYNKQKPNEISVFHYSILMLQLLFLVIIERGTKSNTIEGMQALVKEMLIRLPVNGFIGKPAGAGTQYQVRGVDLSFQEMLFIKGVLESEKDRIWLERYLPIVKNSSMGDATDKYKEVVKTDPQSPEGHCFYLLDRISGREFEIKK